MPCSSRTFENRDGGYEELCKNKVQAYSMYVGTLFLQKATKQICPWFLPFENRGCGYEKLGKNKTQAYIYMLRFYFCLSDKVDTAYIFKRCTLASVTVVPQIMLHLYTSQCTDPKHVCFDMQNMHVSLCKTHMF